MIGLDIGEVESGAFWLEFLRSLRERGLAGVRLLVSDEHKGLKAAIVRVLSAPWQGCTVHFVRNMQQHCRPAQRGLVAAALREVFNADSHEQARERVGQVIARLEPVCPKICRLPEEAKEDLIAFYAFPDAHWSKLRSTNPLERVNREIARCSDVVGIFPNDQSALRLAGALVVEQNDEWLVGRRYLSVESLALVIVDENSATTKAPWRRCASSKRPEQPTLLRTSGGYTTSCDLTPACRRQGKLRRPRCGSASCKGRFTAAVLLGQRQLHADDRRPPRQNPSLLRRARREPQPHPIARAEIEPLGDQHQRQVHIERGEHDVEGE